MGWHGSLALRYRSEDGRTRVHDRHDGPLRVLRSLHPEGERVCHSVLVHPPGGIVGGDTLAIEIELEPEAHALVTTPGATRFYRSLGEPATQTLAVRAAAGSRLEWLPLETLAYSGCIAENRARFALAPGAEMIGWDLHRARPAGLRPALRRRPLHPGDRAAGALAGARHGPRRRPGAARLAARLGRAAHPGDALVRRRRAGRGRAPGVPARRRAQRLRRPSARSPRRRHAPSIPA